VKLDKWFVRISRAWERYLFTGTLVLLFLLITFQIIMFRDTARNIFSITERKEGEVYLPVKKEEYSNTGNQEAPGKGEGSLTEQKKIKLEVVSPQKEIDLKVIIDHEKEVAFKNNTASLFVNPGELIEVKGELDEDVPAVVKVVSSPGLKYPSEGKEVTVFGEYEIIGWVLPEEDGEN